VIESNISPDLERLIWAISVAVSIFKIRLIKLLLY